MIFHDFHPHLACQRFLNYAFNERREKSRHTHILVCHGLPSKYLGAVTTFSLAEGGSFPSHMTTCVERAWWIRWQRMKIWVMIADMHKRVFYSCNMPKGPERDDILDIGPLVCEVLLPKFYVPFDHRPGTPLVCWGGLCFLWAQRLVP